MQIRNLLRNSKRSWRIYYIITALGIIVHEYAHKSFAEDRGLEIEEMYYFNLNKNPIGKVKLKHGPRTYSDLLAINIAPFILNSSLAYVIFTGIFITTHHMSLPDLEIWWEFALLGLSIAGMLGLSIAGISLSLHAFPSQTDIQNIYSGKIEIWNRTEPRVLQWISKHTDGNLLLTVLLSIIWIPLRIIHILIYIITHPQIILALPFVIIVDALSRTKKYGSNFIYTAALLYLCYQSTIIYINMIGKI